MPDPSQVAVLDEKMERLLDQSQLARFHQRRKHLDWDENYELYRNKVKTNRLTQRHAVNIPLMKETIKTILSKIDDPPQVDWKEKSSDEMKEVIFQEIWNQTFKDQKLEWLDIIDKKNVLLYGLSTKFFNPEEEQVKISVLDTYDVVFDPLMDPFDMESARFIIRLNIFRTLEEILADDRYTTAGKNKLKIWSETPDALIQSSVNKEEYRRKMRRLRSMVAGTEGLSNDFNYAAGDVLINLTEHYNLQWNDAREDWDRHVTTYADEWAELQDDLLEDLIGVDKWPFTVWFEDPETNDIYPDGVADLVRTPNKIVNVWYSQMIESRTLSNFGMHWYDSTNDNYTPQTYEAGPGRMLPAPGNPKETIMPVELNSLDETMNAIDFITQIVERGSGAVAIDKGVNEQSGQTLGEVEILVGKAMERTVSSQKFYRGSWEESCVKWAELIQANPPKNITLYRTGQSGKLYEKKVTPNEWKSEAGYEPVVSSTSEQEANDIKNIQKFNFVIAQNPENSVLKEILQSRELEILDLTPDELKRVEEEEKRMREVRESAEDQSEMQSIQLPEQPQPAAVGGGATPVPVQNPQEDAQALAELEGALAQV